MGARRLNREIEEVERGVGSWECRRFRGGKCKADASASAVEVPVRVVVVDEV